MVFLAIRNVRAVANRRLLLRAAILLAAIVVVRSAPCMAQMAGDPARNIRDLSGTVTDPGHEPLRGAIVKLQQGDTPTIMTYITGEDGRYHFKRLDGQSDYRVWVSFRKRSSKAREISKFDSNMDKVINFTIQTF